MAAVRQRDLVLGLAADRVLCLHMRCHAHAFSDQASATSSASQASRHAALPFDSISWGSPGHGGLNHCSTLAFQAAYSMALSFRSICRSGLELARYSLRQGVVSCGFSLQAPEGTGFFQRAPTSARHLPMSHSEPGARFANSCYSCRMRRTALEACLSYRKQIRHCSLA